MTQTPPTIRVELVQPRARLAVRILSWAAAAAVAYVIARPPRYL
jgi:hypothetical protein